MLIVHDFGISFVTKRDADELPNVLKDHLKMDIECNGGLYFVIALDRNYKSRYIDITMP